MHNNISKVEKCSSLVFEKILIEIFFYYSRDRKKKKFITVGQNDAKTKKIKTESGQWIQASYKTNVYVLYFFLYYLINFCNF